MGQALCCNQGILSHNLCIVCENIQPTCTHRDRIQRSVNYHRNSSASARAFGFRFVANDDWVVWKKWKLIIQKATQKRDSISVQVEKKVNE